MFTYLDDTIEIVASLSPPFSDHKTMRPHFDELLMKGGIFPWFWDIRQKKFYIHDSILDKITRPDPVHTTLHKLFTLNVFKDDLNPLIDSLIKSYRKREFEPVNFRIFLNDREALHWFRMEGAFLFDGDLLLNATGYLVNITQYRKIHQHLPDSTDYFKAIIDTIPLPVFYKDKHLIFRYHNDAFRKVLQKEAEQINGKNVFDLEPTSLAQIFDQADRELLENPLSQIYESSVRFGDGSFRNIVFRKNAILSETGEVEGITGILSDVTEARRMSERLEKMVMMKDLSLMINQAILETSGLKEILNIVMEQIRKIITKADCGSILLLDANNCLNMEVFFGYKADEAEKFSIHFEESFLWDTGVSPGEKPVIIPDLSRIKSFKKFPPIPETVDGIPVQSTLSAPIVSHEQVLGIVSLDSYKKNVFNEEDLEIMRYLKEYLLILLKNQQTFQRLLQQSRFDSLTGLASRSYLNEQLDKAVKRAGRNSSSFVLAMIDLDDLKTVNDKWGHEVGDELLRVTAASIQKAFRSTDLFGRLGGDEFVGIFFDTEIDSCEKKFYKLQKESPVFRRKGHSFSCRFSFGLAEYGLNGDTPGKLLDYADNMMYEMKRRKKKY